VAADQAGAGAIGLNFYPNSSRYVTDQQAAYIVNRCPRRLQKVGVFVDCDVDRVLRTVASLSLDWVQLHGNEAPEVIKQLNRVRVIRAFRCRGDLQPVHDYLAECRSLGCRPQAVLLDAWHPTHFGGSGSTLDWQRLQIEIETLAGMPWILAGGLRPSNVASAVRLLRPDGVDTASGVESAPGIKDPAQIAEFVQTARAAMAAGEPTTPGKVPPAEGCDV
jgi:phosphoribosylanthranilate isomerase